MRGSDIFRDAPGARIQSIAHPREWNYARHFEVDKE
jgi:hypothetical protein